MKEIARSEPAHPAVNFTAFYGEQHDRVRYWLAACVRDGRLRRDDLDDVLSDTFLRAWVDRHACREPAKWVKGVAQHALAEYGRQQGLWRKRWTAGERAERYLHETGAQQPPSTQPDGPREQAGLAALDELTARLLDADPRLVEALRLHYVEGLDWRDCAVKVGWTARWLQTQRAKAGLPLTPQRRQHERGNRA